MKLWFRNNGLSLVFIVLFLIAIFGQAVTGQKEFNDQMIEKGGQTVDFYQYLFSGHFSQATFENWESEFLQMTLFVILSMFLYQKGSSESKDPDGKNEVDREPSPKRKGAPWPVRRGGWILQIYKHSLCYALSLLFILSFLLHWHGSLNDYNLEQILKHQPAESAFSYLSHSRFWFESFQNWQSEFLSVFAIVVLTIFLREKNSPQSKPVDAPNSETGS